MSRRRSVHGSGTHRETPGRGRALAILACLLLLAAGTASALAAPAATSPAPGHDGTVPAAGAGSAEPGPPGRSGETLADEAAAHSQEGGHGHAAGDERSEDEGSGHGDPHGGEAGHGDEGGHGHASALGTELGLHWIIPFAGILLSIAVFPLIAAHFWHEHYPKVALAWAVLFALPFLFSYGSDALHAILHIYLLDYFPFIILLWGLFTVAGGIVVRGALRGTPAVNTVLLAIGTLLASWVGTTGAAMVLIRPVLRANAHRRTKVHVVVFFIFLVANIGGSLTPLGDPPLFLGFLHGVPFSWTLIHMPIPMLTLSGILLAVFYALDTWYARREDAPPPKAADDAKFAMAGLHNVPLLGGIVAAVLMSGLWDAGEITVYGIHLAVQNLLRDALIIAIGLVSLRTTRKSYRRENEFSWGPIREVAYLFAGIFMTIIPALEILKAGESGALAGLIRSVREPWHYFWVTGTLSAFLDNAPTYLTFFNTALGSFFPGLAEKEAVIRLIDEQNVYLLAIATGAVFMGACSYIGNAPNFMVKSIAEEAGIEMPSFFGYIVRWTLPVLVPCFVLVTLLYLV